MTPFCFEHVFFVPAPEDLLAAYFDPDHQLVQDRALDVIEREVLEQGERDGALYMTRKIVPRRQLPPFLRPFTSGPLHYVEHVVWRRPALELAVAIQLLAGRGRIVATYSAERLAPGSVRRRYAGHVSVDVALFGPRVERGIVAEFERSLARAAVSTQSWLASQSQRSVAARA